MSSNTFRLLPKPHNSRLGPLSKSEVVFVLLRNAERGTEPCCGVKERRTGDGDAFPVF